MAISVVHSGQTGTGASSSLAITTPSSGNLLVAFIAQKSSNSPINGSDAPNGFSTWTTYTTTFSTYSTGGVDSVFVCYKTSSGNETSLNPTPGTGGTEQGITYFELAGAITPGSIDVVVAGNTTSTTLKTASSGSVTTSTSGSIILSGTGQDAASGVVSAFTGTGPMTNVSTSSTRCIGGYYLPPSTVSSATFTANWNTANSAAMLVASFKSSGSPPPATNPSFFLMM